MATKEVYFDVYCPLCKHYKKDESEDPCWDCLNEGMNEDSHKPWKFEKQESVQKTEGDSKNE